MKALTIGKAAHEAGVGVETIRFYERQGLVAKPRRPNGSGVRVYPTETVERIRFIRQAQQIGFSLREIRELLALQADPSADCSEVREQAVAKLQAVREKIQELHRIGAALEILIAACPGQGGVQACTIMEAIALGSGRHIPEKQTSPWVPRNTPRRRIR